MENSMKIAIIAPIFLAIFGLLSSQLYCRFIFSSEFKSQCFDEIRQQAIQAGYKQPSISGSVVHNLNGMEVKNTSAQSKEIGTPTVSWNCRCNCLIPPYSIYASLHLTGE